MASQVSPSGPLLEVRGLSVSVGSPPVNAVRGIDFSLAAGEVLGVAGESGSGKSVTALALCRLLPRQAQPRIQGHVSWDAQPRNVLSLGESALRAMRGSEVGYIFQEPSACFNPLFSIEAHFKEILALQGVPAHARHSAIEEALLAVGIEPERRHLRALPSDFSGGMLQRAAIACALLPNPRLLIADEPTTALDVTVQSQILELIKDLQAEMGMSTILITHDLGVIAGHCDEVVVMYAGRIVERAPVKELYGKPRHAYTKGLLSSIPTLATPRKSTLRTIEGQVASIKDFVPGCRFCQRMERTGSTVTQRAPFIEISKDHWVEACPECVELKHDHQPES